MMTSRLIGGQLLTIHSQALQAGEGRRTGGVPKREGGPDPCSAICQFAVFFLTRLRFIEPLLTPSRFTKRTRSRLGKIQAWPSISRSLIYRRLNGQTHVEQEEARRAQAPAGLAQAQSY